MTRFVCLAETEAEGDVLGDAQVRVERIVLEHHRDVPLLRCDVVHDAAADRERARGDVLEAGDHSQRGRLAASRRTDQHEELTVVDAERQVEDGLDAIGVDLVDLVERDVSHESHNPPDRGTAGPSRAAATSQRVVP